MKYIDFDGVILDTEGPLFEEWRRNPDRHLLPETEKIRYIQNIDWIEIIKKSNPINESIYCLKHMDPSETAILTRVHSLVNEGGAKIKWVRDNNLKQHVLLVPFSMKKVEVVDPRGNILIDDGLRNLDEWEEKGGIPIFFDKDDDDIDPWHLKNEKKYPKVLSLHRFINKD